MDAEAEAMVHEYMGLAAALAQQVWRTAPHALELDEMRAIAYLGLVGAADRWKPYCAEKGHDPLRLEYFRPFVVRRVHGALIDAIRSRDWASRSQRTKAKALRDAGQDRGLSHAELAAKTGLSVDEVRATIRDMAARPVSIEGEDLDLSARADVESSVLTRAILTEMVTAIEHLPDEQKAVIALHYHEGMQLQQIAVTLRIPESRASHLHAKAVLAVHEAMMSAADQQRD